MSGEPITPVRVLIADDHRLFAEALEAVLSSEPRIEVVGRAADGGEAVELARRLEPDLVILDISMPVWTASRPPRRWKRCSPRLRC